MKKAATTASTLVPTALAQQATIVTRMTFAASPAQAWHGLMFYEQIAERPPLHLRLLLPRPIRTEGRKSQVGDDARCLYVGGHLLKRVTRIDGGRYYEFAVVEQNLAIGGRMRLRGGAYTLRELPDGCTEVVLTTRYFSPNRPRWLWQPIEAAVCHAFHRYILGAIQRRVEPQDRASETSSDSERRGKSNHERGSILVYRKERPGRRGESVVNRAGASIAHGGEA